MSESLRAISPIDIDPDGRDFFSPSPILEEDKLETVKEQVWKLMFGAFSTLTHSILFVLVGTLKAINFCGLSVMYLSCSPLNACHAGHVGYILNKFHLFFL